MKRRPPRLSSTEAGALMVELVAAAEVEATDGAQMPGAPPDGREQVAMDGRVNLGN